MLNAIEVVLPAFGKITKTFTLKNLDPVDEFHIGGRLAIYYPLQHLNFPSPSYLLDVGCGLGNAACYVASRYKHNVAGIDLTPE